MSNLYMVGGPIGNLEDITYRAVRILNEVDIIFCEDKRISIRLLSHYDIKKPLKSLHQYNEEKTSEYLIDLLNKGQNIAYLSDAGTPNVSDPGAILCSEVRKSKHSVVPIPGPSALTSILSVNGFLSKRTIFEGFISKKESKRKKVLSMASKTCDNIIVYESPFRILSLLNTIKAFCIEENVKVELLVGREITKAYEEWLEGSLEDIIFSLEKKDRIKGEFTVLIYFKK